MVHTASDTNICFSLLHITLCRFFSWAWWNFVPVYWFSFHFVTFFCCCLLSFSFSFCPLHFVRVCVTSVCTHLLRLYLFILHFSIRLYHVDVNPIGKSTVSLFFPLLSLQNNCVYVSNENREHHFQTKQMWRRMCFICAVCVTKQKMRHNKLKQLSGAYSSLVWVNHMNVYGHTQTPVVCLHVALEMDIYILECSTANNK